MKIILVILAIALLLVNLLLYKKDKKTIKKKNNYNFKEILDDEKENIDDFKLELGKIRRELSETIIDLQREIYDLKDEVAELKASNRSLIQKNEVKSKNEETYLDKIIEEETLNDDNNLEYSDINKKAMDIKRLLVEGKSEEEICNFLNIGKGELLLIKSLCRY
ncbi:hypothetical protein [Clostridium sp.]|uniref:hypothetical protein n=1 Tax=Clostridium sp. TaxID=1506 RepID=UPI0039963FAE